MVSARLQNRAEKDTNHSRNPPSPAGIWVNQSAGDGAVRSLASQLHSQSIVVRSGPETIDEDVIQRFQIRQLA